MEVLSAAVAVCCAFILGCRWIKEGYDMINREDQSRMLTLSYISCFIIGYILGYYVFS